MKNIIKKSSLKLRGPKLSQSMSLASLASFPNLLNVELVKTHLEAL
jgi:hypothetical protein